MDELLDQLRERAAGMIREGFDPRASIIDNLTEQMNDEHEGTFTRRDVARVVDDLLLAHYAEQAGWNGPSDCDRLDAAFAEMEKRGVVARQNFSCCGTCGHSEMPDEMAADGRPDLIGYAFYHMQDTEGAVEGGGIYIKFGCGTADGPADEVARRVTAALVGQGLNASWSGSVSECVQVATPDWRKRRANELPLTDEPD